MQMYQIFASECLSLIGNEEVLLRRQKECFSVLQGTHTRQRCRLINLEKSTNGHAEDV